jgi:hypothetical protein
MKKIKLFGGLAIIGMMFLITDCKKKDSSPDNCATLSSNMITAASAYASNQSSANCSAYAQSINSYVNGCSVLTPAEKQTLQNEASSMNCK